MASNPELYNLVWRAFSFVSRPDPSQGEFQTAPEHLNTIDTRPNIPAVVLFPALLTPNLHVRGENGGKIEILVAAPSSPALTPDDVNRHLKFAPGLDAKKRVSDDDLFDDPTDKIKLKIVQADGFGQLSTENVFRGILHDTVSNWLPKELDAFYAIQIDESCLDAGAQTAGGSAVDDGSSDDAAADSSGDSGGASGSDAASTSSGTTDPTPTSDAKTSPAPGDSEYQDFLIAGVLQRMNGPALRGSGGFGEYEFEFDIEGVDYSQVDLDQPIVAYHPLYVYPEGSLQTIHIGHVSDIHINARQKLLAKSPARVIDFSAQGSVALEADAEKAENESPSIGSMMNIFERSFLSILDALDSKGIDVLLVGGDLIEHVDNAFPYHDGFDPEKLSPASAAAVWDLVDVDNNYNRNYQSYVDYIAFFTAIRHFCASKGKPAFVVTGNHDCYKNTRIYGISPRLFLGYRKANEGIPADHNLTFYEAMLAFGESWDSAAMKDPFDAQYYEWFYAVLTPFSDFNMQLPKVALVGLAWGDSEESVSLLPGSYGQGVGHLPRADHAVTEAQLALAKPDGIDGKKIVLMTHFTFVSYVEKVAFGDGPVAGHIDVVGAGLFHWSPFGDHDFGTFAKQRSDLYKQVADSDLTSCAFSGHSHRKSMYLLGAADDRGYPTEAYGMRSPTGIVNPTPHIDGRPPIIVSDSAGPVPRLNFDGNYGTGTMFGEYGSDRPSGTMVTITNAGAVTAIEPVYSALDQTKPRLAVAVDYLHVMKNQVFKEIAVEPFERAQATTCQHAIKMVFNIVFPDRLAGGMDIILFAKPSLNFEWIRIVLKQTEFVPHDPNDADKPATATFQLSRDSSQDFFNWLTLGSKSGRFMSFGFASANGLEDIYDLNSRWNIEVEAKPSFLNFWGSQKYDIIPHGENTGLLHFHNEAPDFSWRRQFAPYR